MDQLKGHQALPCYLDLNLCGYFWFNKPSIHTRATRLYLDDVIAVRFHGLNYYFKYAVLIKSRHIIFPVRVMDRYTDAFTSQIKAFYI